MQYDMGTNNIFQRQYLHYFYSGTYNEVAGHYNSNSSSTWQEHNYTGTAGLDLFASNNTLKFWTSSDATNSFMIVDDTGVPIWVWLECGTWFIIGAAGYSSTTDGMNYTLPVGFTGGSGVVAGLPTQNSYNISAYPWLQFDLGFQYNHSYDAEIDNSVNGTVVQGFRGMQSVSTSSTQNKGYSFGLIDSSDILLQIGGYNVNMFPNSSLQKVTDGTNWWLRTSPDISASSLLFPVGTSEPTF
ncbi:hypothetical protein SCRES1_gp63 [Synechococcus phage S-CRES1]|nr:hypothetical protein SCRES1_gp63 [Synechococcus phage S-CRES1]